MENLTSIEQLDYSLALYVNNGNRDEFVKTYGQVTFNEIMMKLRLDGYLREEKVIKSHPIYYTNCEELFWYISFEGKRFHEAGGYRVKALKDANDALWKEKELERQRVLEDLLANNSTYLNELTNRIALATCAAGFAAFALLLWQIFLYLYPVHVNYLY